MRGLPPQTPGVISICGLIVPILNLLSFSDFNHFFDALFCVLYGIVYCVFDSLQRVVERNGF